MIVEEERRKVFYDGLKEARLSLIRVQPGEVTMGRSERVPKRIKFVPRVRIRGCVSGSGDKTGKPLSGSVASAEATKTTTVTPKGKFSSRISFSPGAARERGHELPSPTTGFSSTTVLLIFQRTAYHFSKLTRSIIKYLSISRKSFDILINLSSTKMFVKSILQYFIYPSFIISLLITNLGFIYI